MNYVIGIIDVIKNYTFWKSYNNFMKGDTFRKKFNEWSHRDSTRFGPLVLFNYFLM